MTVQDFPIATTIAGVNMRLTPGGIRQLHWHLPADGPLYSRFGSLPDDRSRSRRAELCRQCGNFPSDIPHSLQGLEPDGCEFLRAFDDGTFSEFDTCSISDWLAHTPKEVRET